MKSAGPPQLRFTMEHEIERLNAACGPRLQDTLVKEGATEAAAADAVARIVRALVRFVWVEWDKQSEGQPQNGDSIAADSISNLAQTHPSHALYTVGAHMDEHDGEDPPDGLPPSTTPKQRRATVEPLAAHIAGIGTALQKADPTALDAFHEALISCGGDECLAKFIQLYRLAAEITPMAQTAFEDTKPRRGRPADHPARQLLRTACHAWHDATGDWPGYAGEDDRYPLLDALRPICMAVERKPHGQGNRHPHLRLTNDVFRTALGLAKVASAKSSGLHEQELQGGKLSEK